MKFSVIASVAAADADSLLLVENLGPSIQDAAAASRVLDDARYSAYVDVADEFFAPVHNHIFFR